jgi:CheY-like chemotaxis protein
LSEQGHKVVLVTSAEQALQEIAEKDFDMVFSDVVMPGMGGLRLAEILAEQRPGLPVVLATGYSQEIADSGIQDRQVILKPYRLATLQDAIRSALTKRGTDEEGK